MGVVTCEKDLTRSQKNQSGGGTAHDEMATHLECCPIETSDIITPGGGRGGGLLPLRGSRDGAAVDEGRVPQCGGPVLGGAAIRVCRALQWAISFTVRERGVVGGPLDGLPESGHSIGCEERGRYACKCDDWARCQHSHSPGEGANGLAIGHVTCHGALRCARWCLIDGR